MSKRVLPGFPLTLGFAVFYLTAIVLIPLAALFLKAADGSWEHVWSVVTSERVVASYRVSFGLSFAAALVNGLFGYLTAWTLVRYSFPGKRLVEGLIDLPFALPTAVAGIALTTLYAGSGWMGGWLEKLGITAVYNRTGIFIALLFITFPFVVRSLQPVLLALSLELEEAAATLGASRWQTFCRVIFPATLPPLLTGMLLAFGRAVGEYGSVIFISGNLPFKTEITPLLIVTRLEDYDYQGAAGIGAVMLLFSLFILLSVNGFQFWSQRRFNR